MSQITIWVVSFYLKNTYLRYHMRFILSSTQITFRYISIWNKWFSKVDLVTFHRSEVKTTILLVLSRSLLSSSRLSTYTSNSSLNTFINYYLILVIFLFGF